MNWFKGEIPEAIVISKNKQAIFVVYVEDPQVPVPSIYFIGKHGLPLEIVTEAKDEKTFIDKLNVILQKAGLGPVVPDNNVPTIEPVKKPSTNEDREPVQPNVEVKKELSEEEKAERARQLIKIKREEKRREEEEKERQREIERRRSGQNVQQLKRWQDEQELKQALDEREKEKRESQLARERVLAQIAQDKAERAMKFSSSPQPQVTPQVSPKPVASNTARLQFRMPDGRTATNDFSSSETLESVHAHIRAHLNLPFSSYTLSTTFPRREFTDGDKSQTLLDLGLVPTAVILILPLNRGAVSTNTDRSFSGFLWTLLTPILTLLGYLKTFVFGSGQNPNPDNNKRAADSNDARYS
ncbi:UBX domain-containing protein 4, partial [Asbolus verrucosus]